ncbi:MAG: hypothetical protein ABW042_10070 [Phenylobacterium sp.]
MRAIVFVAALVIAAPAAAQPATGGLGQQSVNAGGGGARDNRAARRPVRAANVARFERDLRAAAARGNDASRDIWSGWRWDSDMSGRSSVRRRDDFAGGGACRLTRPDLGRTRVSGPLDCGLADDLAAASSDMTVSRIAASEGGVPATTATAPARPVVRTLGGGATVRGASDAPAATYAVRTLAQR